MKQLEPAKTSLLEILSEENVEAEISCLWIMPTSHEYLSLSIELVKKIAELGIQVKIDAYTPGTDVE